MPTSARTRPSGQHPRTGPTWSRRVLAGNPVGAADTLRGDGRR
jgi:hypothetical protein